MARFANWVVASLLIILLLMGAYLQQGMQAPSEGHASVFSSTGHGRSVAFELLSKLGFKAHAWTKAPGELPESPSLLFVSKVPEAPEHYALLDEGPRVLPDAAEPSHDRLYDPIHYQAFVEQGGTLVLSASSDVDYFLERYFGIELVRFDYPDPDFSEELPEDFEFIEDAAIADPPAFSEDSSEDFVMQTKLWADDPGKATEVLDLSWFYEYELEPTPALQLLLAADDDLWLAAGKQVGQGWIVILDTDRFIDNDTLEEEQNALLLVRMAERFAGDRNVLFDEYSLGGWTPDSPLELAFSLPARPLTLHLLALLISVLWLSAWVRWFPRDPAPLAAVSAQMRARGLAALLTRKKRWELLGQMLRLGVLRRLGRRTGMGKQLLEGEQATLQERAGMRALLLPVMRGQGAARLERALELLGPGDLRSRRQLDSLAEELADLELGIMNLAGTKNR